MRQILFLLSFAIVVFLSIFISSCAMKEESASPVSWGYGFNTMPGWVLSGKTSIHAVLDYSRFAFKTGSGHNNFWQAGAQIRQLVTNNLWVAGEVSYVDIVVKYDNSTIKPTASGFAVGPSVGYGFHLGTVPFSVYLTADYLNHGNFTYKGGPSYGSGGGTYGKLGIDLNFMQLIDKKHGR